MDSWKRVKEGGWPVLKIHVGKQGLVWARGPRTLSLQRVCKGEVGSSEMWEGDASGNVGIRCTSCRTATFPGHMPACPSRLLILGAPTPPSCYVGALSLKEKVLVTWSRASPEPAQSSSAISKLLTQPLRTCSRPPTHSLCSTTW